MALTKVVTKCKTVGRCGTGAVKAIVLHEITNDIDSYLADARNCCDRGCEKSLHYVIDGVSCRPYQFVPEADTAWGFSWTPPTTGGFCSPCPTDPAGCDPCSVPTTDPIFLGEVGDLTLLDPNCFVIHVGVLMPRNQTETIPQTPPCGNVDLEACPTPSRLSQCAYDELVKLLCDVYSHFPALPKNATTLRKFGCGLSEIDITSLLADIMACVPAPPPFNRLCHDLNLFPAGIPVNVFGVDASGNCVKGVVGGGSFDLCLALSLLPVGAAGVFGVDSYVGADCQTHLLPAIAPITFQGNSGPDQLVSPGGTFKFFGGLGTQSVTGAVGVQIDVQIDPNPTNQLVLNPGVGLFVPPATGACFQYPDSPAALVHVINHGLGTLTPQMTFYDSVTNAMIIPSNAVTTSPNVVTVTFASPQAIRAVLHRCN